MISERGPEPRTTGGAGNRTSSRDIGMTSVTVRSIGAASPSAPVNQYPTNATRLDQLTRRLDRAVKTGPRDAACCLVMTGREPSRPHARSRPTVWVSGASIRRSDYGQAVPCQVCVSRNIVELLGTIVLSELSYRFIGMPFGNRFPPSAHRSTAT